MTAFPMLRGVPARLSVIACAAALFAGSAAAQSFPPGPPPAPPVPSAEALATIPKLSSAQQIELRRILVEERDALDALRSKTREVIEAQRQKERAEHERIDAQSTDRLRKLLGEDGFRQYAEWLLGQRGPRGGGMMPGRNHGGAMPGGPGRRPGGGPGAGKQPPSGDALDAGAEPADD